MKVLSALFVLSAFVSVAQAANYKTDFKIANPGVQCVDETMSRFTGREVSLKTDNFAQNALLAHTADGSDLRTTVRDLSTAQGNKTCAKLAKSSRVLKGSREMYVTHMESSTFWCY